MSWHDPLLQLLHLLLAGGRLGHRGQVTNVLQALPPTYICSSRHLVLAGQQLGSPGRLPGLQSCPPLTALTQQRFQHLQQTG